ncbi:MAG: DoxX family protein [Nitrososphaerales archaeon]
MNSIEGHILKLPRFSLGIVFLLFGIDKFVGYESYVAWFVATERARVIIPTQDIGQFVYALGIGELILAGLLFSGIIKRATAIAASLALVTILLVAQYPSSYPQDLGLLGIAVALAIFGSNSKITPIDQWFKLSKIIRFSLITVLVLWSVDQIVNTSTHADWLQLFNSIARGLSTDQIFAFIISIAIIELVIAAFVASGRLPKYTYIVASVFFAVAMTLEPPLNGFQSIGLAMAASWLAYLSLKKRP